jgi:predicted nucleic acid-binding protein
MTANTGPLLTTDYVIDETLTLLRARGERTRAIAFGLDVFSGKLATIHYLSPADIAVAWDVFRRFADKDWSFTDCTSKVVLESLGSVTAFSFDQHFRQFGTVTVVP